MDYKSNLQNYAGLVCVFVSLRVYVLGTYETHSLHFWETLMVPKYIEYKAIKYHFIWYNRPLIRHLHGNRIYYAVNSQRASDKWFKFRLVLPPYTYCCENSPISYILQCLFCCLSRMFSAGCRDQWNSLLIRVFMQVLCNAKACSQLPVH